MSRKAQTKKATTKTKKVVELIVEDDVHGTDIPVTSKSQKRLSVSPYIYA